MMERLFQTLVLNIPEVPGAICEMGPTRVTLPHRQITRPLKAFHTSFVIARSHNQFEFRLPLPEL